MKSIIFFIAITFFCFPIVGMEVQVQDPSVLVEELRRFQKISVVIPALELENNEIFDFLVTLKNQSYDQDEYDDLEPSSKDYLNSTLDLPQKLEQLNKRMEESPLLFAKLTIFKELCEELEGLVYPIIFSIVERYKEQSYHKLETILDNVAALVEQEKDRLFIVVFPEAFFNFFRNPSGFGNFIPFFDKIWKDKIVAISQKVGNAIFFMNVLHAEEKQQTSNFDTNFQEFIRGCYEQKKILSAYARYEGIDVIPIFNETFVFYRGQELGRYKKQFILDEDIPFMETIEGRNYLTRDRLLYVPGTNNQDFTTDFLFAVEICQDHVKIQHKKRSKLLIIQSASIDIASNLPSLYEGICIHSDIDKNKSSVYRLMSGKMHTTKEQSVVEMGQLSFQIYNLEGRVWE